MSLALTNKALDLDDQNVSALNHKTTLLFAKRDIDELLLTVNALISLRPEKPYYLGQKALYLEINGNSSEAREYYDSALNKYERYVKSDSLNFNLLLEYVQILVFAGNTSLADESLEKMTRMNFDDDQIKILNGYINQVHPKQQVAKEALMKYWKGEIGYEQLGEVLQ
jgi:tetratricopeptide (TPR) repeat protein